MQGKNQHGLSITELMISLAIAGIVMAGLYNLFISQKKVLGIQDQDAEMHQAARAAMDFMVREFRMLGYGVPNSTWDPNAFTPSIPILSGTNFASGA